MNAIKHFDFRSFSILIIFLVTWFENNIFEIVISKLKKYRKSFFLNTILKYSNSTLRRLVELCNGPVLLRYIIMTHVMVFNFKRQKSKR